MEGTCFILLILVWWGNLGRKDSAGPRAFKVLAGLFVLWGFLQMLPLPPRALAVLSPETSRLYSRYLPGYAENAGGADLQAWLLGRKDTSSGSLPSLPEHTTDSPRPRGPEGINFRIRAAHGYGVMRDNDRA